MRNFWRSFLENTILAMGIASFWPIVLGYEAFWYQCLLVLIAFGLAVLALMRFRRIKREYEDAETVDIERQVK
ncbi:MAG TPA: hypothetical protein PKO36_14320 [Candidatus Hydrogenedentes bacterium]|nr:hypothetical protein [Candidatus Hydrogenedentota bacterium]HOV75867.1 hypothetical protein [Candidatus Hydrogenedentota bacterium]HPC15096.1 hypothetical protein [Candidatus Hydrogenedentota bacterium]HRT19043.1 hypothetical protein [Candidatus Hydrogenedentota bacterium]HRT63972.1 hypothetical protein [Candidatus Hydrogenedentota bacterium]